MPISRRKFIKTTAIGLTAIPFANSLASIYPDYSSDLYLLSDQLTRQWGKTLLGLQVTDKTDTLNYGAIYCAADKTVHGRIADTIYPFFYLAEKTQDSRYLDAAELLFGWAGRRVSQSDGSWLNDPVPGAWKGITVFSSIALAETLMKHGHLAGSSFKNEITERLKKAGDFIYKAFSMSYGNINYPIAASYALTLLGELLDNTKYTIKGREFAHAALANLTKNGFLFGEGHPYDKPSPKGCFPVDLGYNVEESLPNLVLYGLHTKDEEILGRITRAMQTHMEFMLPDGAWDNSWGTRNYKWTYWGSRTSDGCQPAFALLADRDQRFYKVALKNTQLLQQCTHNGLLTGGPHYASHGIPTCVHHTFCHIKALTTILDHKRTEPNKIETPVKLPRETAYGVRSFADVQTWLIAKGKFRATVTVYDREYTKKNGHATGGALTMLWHPNTGPILCASMNEYQLIEENNMQRDTDQLAMPLTPRIELKLGNVAYMNISDLSAKIEVKESADLITVSTRSKLVNAAQQSPPSGEINCRVDYLFSDKKVIIRFDFDKTNSSENIKIVVPVISRSDEKVSVRDNEIQINRASSTIKIASNNTIYLLPTTTGRLFNFVPGLEAVPLGIDQNNTEVSIEVI